MGNTNQKAQKDNKKNYHPPELKCQKIELGVYGDYTAGHDNPGNPGGPTGGTGPGGNF